MKYYRQTCCGPTALAAVFNQPYNMICHRVERMGGSYRCISFDILNRLLRSFFGIRRDVYYKSKPNVLKWAKRRRGWWFIAAQAIAADGRPSGHAIVLKDGELIDNGYIQGSLYAKDMYIIRAWKLDVAQ